MSADLDGELAPGVLAAQRVQRFGRSGELVGGLNGDAQGSVGEQRGEASQVLRAAADPESACSGAAETGAKLPVTERR
jgi:hypothetical protein